METADQWLARLSPDQLRVGIAKGRSQLAVIDELEKQETMFGDGPFPNSKQYEAWSGRDYAEGRRLLSMAISDSERELSRREPLPAPQPVRDDEQVK